MESNDQFQCGLLQNVVLQMMYMYYIINYKKMKLDLTNARLIWLDHHMHMYLKGMFSEIGESWELNLIEFFM